MLLLVQFRETVPVLLLAGSTGLPGAPQTRNTVQAEEVAELALSV